MVRSFVVSGVELAKYVTDWANISETKEVLLAKATLFTGELELVLSNAAGQFSPEKEGSLFYARNIFNIEATVTIDGQNVFQGFLKDVAPDNGSKTATFKMENIFSKPAETVLPEMTESDVNPVAAMISMITEAGLEDLADIPSFLAAAGPSNAAGAVVDLNISAGSNTTLMNGLQQLSELASVSVFVRGGLIRARAFRLYQGDESGLRQVLNPAMVRNFRSLTTAYTNFNNKVVVNYGASSKFEMQDSLSIGLTKVTRAFEFNTATGQPIAVPDLVSAQYFAQTFLQRAAAPPRVAVLEVGVDLLGVEIGDRFPVTCPNWGLVRSPYELIDTDREVQQGSATLTLRSL